MCSLLVTSKVTIKQNFDESNALIDTIFQKITFRFCLPCSITTAVSTVATIAFFLTN